MSVPTPLRSHVRPERGGTLGSDISHETFERLIVAVGKRYGQAFEPMMTTSPFDPAGWQYRAWIRFAAGGRVFGKPAATAEAAVEALIAKVGRA